MYCFHPVYVPDKVRPGKVISVPCGKCAGCLSHRADEWRTRLNVELSQHRFNFFVTLTYSDDFVPHFHPEDVMEYPMTDFRRANLLSFLSNNDVSNDYLVLKYEDIQKFIKRLRQLVVECEFVPSWQKMLRFYCCGEYGPTTKRPHYHLLFFLDAPYLGECVDGKYVFERFVDKAWSFQSKVGSSERLSFGRIDVQPVAGDASKYVSSYVTSFCDIPKLLQQPPFRPFCVASKSPPIGSFRFDVEEAKKVVFNGSLCFNNKFGEQSKKNVDVFFWKSLKDNLFPKCFRYSELSPSDRFLLYGCARFPFRGCSFVEFLEYVYEREDSPFVESLKRIFGVDDLSSFKMNGSANASLLRQWRISRSVLVNCGVFDVSLGRYVAFIDNYYDKKDYINLINQLKFEQDYAYTGDSRFLLSFVDSSVLSSDLCSLSIEDKKYVLESFGFTDFDDPVQFDWFSLPEVKDKIQSVKDFVSRGKSFKAIKDYKVNSGFSNLEVI